MSSVSQMTTADELLTMPRGRARFELVKGALLTMSPAGSEHGSVVGTLFLLVASFLRKHRLGVVFGAETGFLLERDPDTVLAPDIAFVRRERIPASGIPRGYWPGAPDLAVEVVSPNDSLAEVERKAQDWLAPGACAVWIVSPQRRSVSVVLPDGNKDVIGADGILTGGDLLPGFQCPVREIFEMP